MITLTLICYGNLGHFYLKEQFSLNHSKKWLKIISVFYVFSKENR